MLRNHPCYTIDKFYEFVQEIAAILPISAVLTYVFMVVGAVAVPIRFKALRDTATEREVLPFASNRTTMRKAQRFIP